MDRPIADRDRRRWRRPAVIVGIGLPLLGMFAATGLHLSTPTLDRHTVVLDTVAKGPLERVISGPGKLVPAEERVIAAYERALVENVYADPGAKLVVGEQIIRLVNPETQRELLEAKRDLVAAESELVNLSADLQKQLLDFDARTHQLHFEELDAVRRAAAFADVAKNGWVPELDLKRAHDLVLDLQGRIEIENKKKSFLEESRVAKLRSQNVKIEQLRSIVRFQQERNDRMHVKAPIAGTLQEVVVEEGQWVEPGQTLARVIVPTKLKVVLRMPQTNAGDIALGQEASIDTRIGVVRGYVNWVDPVVQDGSVVVEIKLSDPLPRGARSQLSVFGTISVARIADALSIARPAGALPHTTGTLFRVDANQSSARLVPVAYGESTGNRIELVKGGHVGDEFIISDVSPWTRYTSIKLGD